MKRSAPVGGYTAYGTKREYRRQVWATIRRMRSDSGLSKATALVLPSKEGDEIRIAESRGINPSRLIAVDKNPALLATAPWRKRYPTVTVIGSEIARAGERIVAAGKTVDIANLDLCSCASAALRKTLGAFVETGVLSTHAVVAVTILRGREHRTQTAKLNYWADMATSIGIDAKLADSLIGNRHLTARDIGRMAVVSAEMFASTGRWWRPERIGIYKTHKSSMLWWIMDTYSPDNPRHREQLRENDRIWDERTRYTEEIVAPFVERWEAWIERNKLRRQIDPIGYLGEDLAWAEEFISICNAIPKLVPSPAPDGEWLGVAHYRDTEIAIESGRLGERHIMDLLGGHDALMEMGGISLRES